MKKIRNGVVLSAVTMAVGGLVIGCGTGSSSNSATGNSSNATTPTKSKTTTIVWAASPITHTGLRKTLIQMFEKAHPNIRVQLQNQNSNTDTNKASLTTAISGGSSTPDVYMGDVIWPAQFAHAHLAQPLNAILPKTIWSRFSKGLIDGVTYKGKEYAVPFFADTAFLYYRKDLLKEAHLPVPKTWEQLKHEAEILQKDKLVKYGFAWQGASYEGLTCDFVEYLADAGGKVLNSSGQPTIDSPQAKEALNFMVGLIKSGVSPKATVTFEEPQTMNLFDQGQVAFLRNWTYAWANSQDKQLSKVVGEVGVTELPTFPGGKHYGCVGGWNLYINPHSKHFKADAKFMEFMTSKEAQNVLAKKFGELPTNKAVQDESGLSKYNPDFGVLKHMHLVSRPDQTPQYSQLSKALYTNVNAALAGSKSVDAALKDAESQMDAAVNNAGL
jgi:multiple sugar transport system substrate-binding protein